LLRRTRWIRRGSVAVHHPLIVPAGAATRGLALRLGMAATMVAVAQSLFGILHAARRHIEGFAVIPLAPPPAPSRDAARQDQPELTEDEPALIAPRPVLDIEQRVTSPARPAWLDGLWRWAYSSSRRGSLAARISSVRSTLSWPRRRRYTWQ